MRNYILLHEKRSGSNYLKSLLMRNMRNNGVNLVHLKEDILLKPDCLDIIKELNSSGSSVLLKLSNNLEFITHDLALYFKENNYTVVVSYREDKYNQCLSYLLSSSTNFFSSHAKETYDDIIKFPVPVSLVRLKKFKAEINKFSKNFLILRKYNLSYHFYEYEEIANKNVSTKCTKQTGIIPKDSLVTNPSLVKSFIKKQKWVNLKKMYNQQQNYVILHEARSGSNLLRNILLHCSVVSDWNLASSFSSSYLSKSDISSLKDYKESIILKIGEHHWKHVTEEVVNFLKENNFKILATYRSDKFNQALSYILASKYNYFYNNGKTYDDIVTEKILVTEQDLVKFKERIDKFSDKLLPILSSHGFDIKLINYEEFLQFPSQRILDHLNIDSKLESTYNSLTGKTPKEDFIENPEFVRAWIAKQVWSTPKSNK